MKLTQSILIFFMVLPGSCFSMMKSERFTEEPMISSTTERMHLKSLEEIKQMSRSDLKLLRRSFKIKMFGMRM